MASRTDPHVLMVDDNVEQLRALAGLIKCRGCGCDVLGPGDVSQDDLAIADLVLVD